MMIQNIHCRQIVRPLRTRFSTARGSKSCATSIIIEVTCDNGISGIGEVPTSFVVPQETPDTIKRTIRKARQILCNQPIKQWFALSTQLRTCFPNFHMTCSGLEVAMLRAWLICQDRIEHGYWGKKLNTVNSDITIPFIPEMNILKPWLQRAIQTGFETFKIKVSGHVKKDIGFIRSIAEMLSEAEISYTIRLDGNQGFTCDSALRLLDALPEKVELLEQPLKDNDYKGMKHLCKISPIPIIADETVFTVDDCRRVIDEQLAHGINIKIAKCGIIQSAEIIKAAKQAGLKLMIGCMTETMVGLSAAIYCAAGSGKFDYIDLDSVHFLNHRKTYGDIAINGPAYHLRIQV